MKNNQYLGLIDLLEKYNRKVKETKALSTFTRYDKLKSLVSQFIHKQYMKQEYPLSDIDINFLLGFENFLMKSYNYKVNTISKQMDSLRHVFAFVYNDLHNEKNPFKHYHIKRETVKREYLSESELKSILTTQFKTKRLEQVRDVFIFSCFTGLGYADLMNLSADNLQENKDKGTKNLILNRCKNNVPLTVPLLDIAQKIIKKYINKSTNGKLLPLLSIQKMNEYLKEIGSICHIDKGLSFRVARHTFISTVTFSKGVPLETISKMVGHNNIKTTQAFIPKGLDKIEDDMMKLSDQFTSLTNSFAI